MSIFSVASAHDGSKGTPCKNIELLSGKSLIEWSIDAAKGASCV